MYWSRVGDTSNIEGVLIRRQPGEDRDITRMPCEDKAEMGAMMPQAKEHQAQMSATRSWDEARKRSSPLALD